MKVGDRVVDKWYYEWGLGTVIKTLRTRVHVRFSNKLLVYDKEHQKFLEKLGE